MAANRIQNVIDAIEELVQEEHVPVRFAPNPLETADVDDLIDASLRNGEYGGYTATPAPRAPRLPAHPDTCEFCGQSWHGLSTGECAGSGHTAEDDEEPFETGAYTVTFEVEVDQSLANTPREAALIALKLFMQGEVGCTVGDPNDDEHNVTIVTAQANGAAPRQRRAAPAREVPGPSVGNRRTRWMNLRYRGQCQCCGVTIERGLPAHYNAETRKVTCTKVRCTTRAGVPRYNGHVS